MPSFVKKPRRKVVLLIAGGVGLMLLGAFGGAVVLLSGAYSTAATTQHFRITHRLLDAGLRFSVRTHASEIEAPALDAPDMLERGAACFREYCVQCHGAPGVARDEAGRGMLPIASNLAQSGREWPPEWLYYVTKKGVRMSGMPAWQYRMSERSLWSTVAFLKRLPFLTHEAYRDLAAQSIDAACEPPAPSQFDYDPAVAKEMFRQYACDSCHIIGGVVGPVTHVGPPLVDWPRRKYIAGVLPNDEENLIRFIREPQSVSERTLMPDLEVADAHARAMAAYLFAQD